MILYNLVKTRHHYLNDGTGDPWTGHTRVAMSDKVGDS